ncbi:hypothetical protein PALB_11970 [Pseudoalteromonas luteoviolacea B = ATCC 29581]|nr:hypothetical protein PALB_11970 [Pseudoalteromonas luteoviolacea B = ATCC 29581]
MMKKDKLSEIPAIISFHDHTSLRCEVLGGMTLKLKIARKPKGSEKVE